MKRTVILILLLALMLTGCRTICLTGSGGQITYHYGEVAFTEELTAEELEQVVKILDGKALHSVKTSGEPSCGFSPEIAITVDGTVYMLARDDCGTVRIDGSDDYIQISEEERTELERLFTSRSGSFPCV